MENTLLLIIAGFSLGYNILQKNKIKSERLQKERDYKFYLEDEKRLREENFKALESEYKTLEVDLYNLDWAYDELMKEYNSNALDLYFWNLLPKSDRETRRRFINKGQYKVYRLEDGRVAFEVI